MANGPPLLLAGEHAVLKIECRTSHMPAMFGTTCHSRGFNFGRAEASKEAFPAFGLSCLTWVRLETREGSYLGSEEGRGQRA